MAKARVSQSPVAAEVDRLLLAAMEWRLHQINGTVNGSEASALARAVDAYLLKAYPEKLDDDHFRERVSLSIWPLTCDVPYEMLSAKIAEYCQELNQRENKMREYQLERAIQSWPDLWKALQERGKQLTFPGKPPVMPEWADEAVVALKKCYTKPRTKVEAWEIVRLHGDGGWAKISELWLWLVDAGPIMERGMAKYGYLMPRKK